jgi:hypothetical protein
MSLLSPSLHPPSSGSSTPFPSLLHAAHSQLALARSSPSPPLSLLRYTHALRLFRQCGKVLRLSGSPADLQRAVSSLADMAEGFVNGLGAVVSPADVRAAAAAASASPPPGAGAPPPSLDPPEPGPVPPGAYSGEDLTQSTHIRRAIRTGLRPLHVPTGLGASLSASQFMEAVPPGEPGENGSPSSPGSPGSPSSLKKAQRAAAAAKVPPPPPESTEVSDMLALQSALSSLSAILSLPSPKSRPGSSAAAPAGRRAAGRQPRPLAGNAARDYLAAAALDGSFCVVPADPPPLCVQGGGGGGPGSAGPGAAGLSASTIARHPPELGRLLATVKTLADENAALLARNSELAAGGAEAARAREAMATFRREYEGRFRSMREALDRFRAAYPGEGNSRSSGGS